jgi:L-threonylcarbamoyladenylate synthase
MKRHYSPGTPVLLHPALTRARAVRGPADEAWLFVARPRGKAHPPNLFWLDRQGDLRRAARRLFSVLRDLDGRGFRRIHVERPKGRGIGEALLDRLVRASSR